MKSACGKVALALGTLLLCASWQTTSAASFGTYVKFEKDSNVDWTFSTSTSPVDYTPSGSIQTLGVGFVLDTSPTDKGVFNYRLNVGYEQLEATIDDPSLRIDTFTLNGLAVDHTFGFAVFKREKVRVWLGPQLKVGFYSGNEDRLFGASSTIVGARVGLGFLVGANFKVASHCTIAGTLGVSKSAYGGVQTFSDPNFDDVTIAASGKAAPNVHLSFLF